MGQENWNKHRRRWLDRIKVAEKKADIIEKGLHLIIDEIELNNIDIEITRQLLIKLGRLSIGADIDARTRQLIIPDVTCCPLCGSDQYSKESGWCLTEGCDNKLF